ncbi:Uncharacterized protein dnl_03200 [Desulfonema limicola]|uniref:RiboL-PSP-HEPN domain-containing protein n=1 Tax=Desulfonema limicola TaxID=45656 RepID=A0A975B3H9_9BACT|nr:hypothetical protein [Desulfonema limicola]QTA78108.1 Uncharacterized protein dnl_03200 [Desulfonema limicola]
MSSKFSLVQIWKSYEVMRDCLKIAQRSISENNLQLLKKTIFLTGLKNEAEKQIKSGQNDANDYVILSLWAAFERIIIEYIQIQGQKILDIPPSDFNKKVHSKIERDIEYRKTEDVLDMFKSYIDSDLIGQAKQIKKYRDWVAHRNVNKGTPANVPPHNAYRILSEIIDKLEQHSDFGSI